MNAGITVNKARLGWIYYDANCPLCVRAVGRTRAVLERLGYELLPLQTPGLAGRLGVSEEALAARMHLLTTDGLRFSGAEALIEIFRHARWMRPLATVARVPGILNILQRGYDWVAAHRHCSGGSCLSRGKIRFTDWLPLLLLPLTAFLVREHVAGWVFMGSVAFALYAGCKWLTYRNALARGMSFNRRHATGFLLGWVGMEPKMFSNQNSIHPLPVEKIEWVVTAGRILAGAFLVWIGPGLFAPESPLIAGWLGMFGVILVMHFGFFHLLALLWRHAGVPVQPLMLDPLHAISVGDFWGKRWNTGFHQLAQEFVFRPLLPRIGHRWAVMAVFLASGLIHELVITLPATGGYGLPTAYFALQGFALLLERSEFGRRLNLAAGFRGRAFAWLIVAGPVFWLFPPVFVHNVIMPMLSALGATRIGL